VSGVNERPLRVHYYSDSYIFGGSEHMVGVLLDAAVASDAIDARFTYRHSRAYDDPARRRVPAGIPINGIRLPNPEDLWSSLVGVPRRLVKGAAYATFVRQAFQVWDVGRLYQIFRADQPDVVHVNNGGFPAAASCNAAAVAARLAGVPVVVYVVNNRAVDYRTPLRWPDLPLDRVVARSVTRFVTGSQASAAALRRVLHLPEEAVAVLPNGVAPRAPDETRAETRAWLGQPAEHVVVLVPARLESRKGHRHLFAALELIARRRGLDGVGVVVAGDGPEECALKADVDRRGLTGSVKFIPSQPNWWNLYAAADIVVLPSIENEDFPNVVIEAMAMARSVIGTRLAGIPEQIDEGVTGLVVKPGDAEELAAALTRLIDDAPLRRNFGEAGQSRFDALFRPEVAVRRYWSLYRELYERALS
jgi:glycosyltransferase involved in cell wall biosynthesis